jgi:hypothetical protein
MLNGFEVAYIFYYIIAAISISMNLAVLVYLFSKNYRKDWKLFTIILIYLHVSITAEEITAIPFIWKYNNGLCLAIEAFKFYFGLKNVFCILMLVRTYSRFIRNATDIYFTKSKLRMIQFFLTVFPMIAFLPFADGTYTFPSHPWCSLPSTRSIAWEIAIQYFWVWFLLVYMLVENGRIIYQLWTQFDSLLLNNYMAKVGAYSLVSFVCWIPRTLVRFSHSQTEGDEYLSFISYFPMYISGIFFAILFAKNIKQIEAFQDNLPQKSADLVDLSSWEKIFDRNSRLTLSGKLSSKSMDNVMARSEGSMSFTNSPMIFKDPNPTPLFAHQIDSKESDKSPL